ncbi:RDD family protein [Flavobacterium psychrotolerans]|uniref:RDD family protein n=1 Tax=Flavobacterium psychrotolerans TaxID=2169410 RepID=A0A2U1JHT0_9FLAO|nr:RDD family protein [Flavobacterium psychrotolerans]PWA04565.1 RDD family protein [Flavobacterium psychrotolerans]
MENKKFTVTDDLLASNGQRFLNLTIDLFVQYIIGLSIWATLNIIAQITNNDGLYNWVGFTDRMIQFLFGMSILIFYYGITELYFSRTIAKYFTKTLVVMRNGSKPNAKTIIQRTLCRLIPFEAFTFLGKRSRGWHDSFSHTYVVRKHRFIEKKNLSDSID